MTDNEKLARWQGKCYHVSDWGKTDCKYCGRTNDPRYFDFDSINPDYLNDDAAAMSLLDTLVEKGLGIQLYNTAYEMTGLYKSRWCCKLTKGADVVVYPNPYPTRREAVVASVLELIGKEDA